MARCFPSLEKIKSARVPLKESERHLLEFLMNNLSHDYEIYVQPVLNGDHPDFLIIKPNAGVLIIEVKDWDLQDYNNPRGGLAPWQLKKDETYIRSPLAQVEAYKSNLYELHIDQLFESNIKDKAYFSAVQLAVYFHYEKTDDVDLFCHNVQFINVFGYDGLNQYFFEDLLRKSGLNQKSKRFNQILYTSFQDFLSPSKHLAHMGIYIHYTRRQKELTQSCVKDRKKIRGVAGSGKTKVLAKRAMNCYLRTHRPILILTFNITLRNYIHDRLSEIRTSFPWSAFEITNYHYFFKTQANNYNLNYTNLLVDSNRVNFFESVRDQLHSYAAILVDEVQDYKSNWLRLLVNHFLEEDGEFIVFGDEKQNIYGREMGGDHFPVIPDVPGRWNVLKGSFRMNDQMSQIAQAFQQRYFQGRYVVDEYVKTKQGDLFEGVGEVSYYDAPNVSGTPLFHLIHSKILEMKAHPNHLVILTPTFKMIRHLDYCFRHLNHEETNYIGETEEEYRELLSQHTENSRSFKSHLKRIRRGRELHFWQNSNTIKLSTIHSFKGWEAHTLILVISDLSDPEIEERSNELIYTALTRARQNLIVIDTTTGTYRAFFEKFVERDEHNRA